MHRCSRFLLTWNLPLIIIIGCNYISHRTKIRGLCSVTHVLFSFFCENVPYKKMEFVLRTPDIIMILLTLEFIQNILHFGIRNEKKVEKRQLKISFIKAQVKTFQKLIIHFHMLSHSDLKPSNNLLHSLLIDLIVFWYRYYSFCRLECKARGSIFKRNKNAHQKCIKQYSRSCHNHAGAHIKKTFFSDLHLIWFFFSKIFCSLDSIFFYELHTCIRAHITQCIHILILIFYHGSTIQDERERDMFLGKKWIMHVTSCTCQHVHWIISILNFAITSKKNNTLYFFNRKEVKFIIHLGYQMCYWNVIDTLFNYSSCGHQIGNLCGFVCT